MKKSVILLIAIIIIVAVVLAARNKKTTDVTSPDQEEVQETGEEGTDTGMPVPGADSTVTDTTAQDDTDVTNIEQELNELDLSGNDEDLADMEGDLQ